MPNRENESVDRRARNRSKDKERGQTTFLVASVDAFVGNVDDRPSVASIVACQSVVPNGCSRSTQVRRPGRNIRKSVLSPYPLELSVTHTRFRPYSSPLHGEGLDQANSEKVDCPCVFSPFGNAMSTKNYTSMVEAIEELKKRGFTANFEFLDHTFRDVSSGRTFKADELTIVEHYRFEGVSDPDDMSVVYAIESDDGRKGIVADAFGLYANASLGEFLEKVELRG